MYVLRDGVFLNTITVAFVFILCRIVTFYPKVVIKQKVRYLEHVIIALSSALLMRLFHTELAVQNARLIYLLYRKR